MLASRLVGSFCIAISVVSIAPAVAPAQDASAALLALNGKDTSGFEQFARRGNVVTGSWVVLHAPGVYVHQYRITVGPDGRPTRYVMNYSEPLSIKHPDLDSVVVEYGRDTATYTLANPDSTWVRKLPLHDAFPFLGQSMAGLDLALRRLHAMHADSGTIVGNAPTQLETPPAHLLARLAGDSAFVGPAMRVHLDADGGFDGLAAGPVTIQRLASIDMPGLTKHFVDEYAPRMAAINKAASSRVEISLPADQLDRFVGKYSLPQVTVSVTRDAGHLVFTFPGQPGWLLLAMGPTAFFVRNPDLTVTFDVDARGAVSGMIVGQGEVKQRFTRVN